MNHLQVHYKFFSGLQVRGRVECWIAVLSLINILQTFSRIQHGHENKNNL